MSVRTVAPPVLATVGPSQSLVILVGSKTQAEGGGPPARISRIWPEDLMAARTMLAARAVRRETAVEPAWRRYSGSFFTAAAPAVEDAAGWGRTLILSAGYGIVDAREPIGSYEARIRLTDWPKGLMERLIAERAEQLGGDVVAFAAAGGDAARLLQRVEWTLRPRRRALLVSVDKDAAGGIEDAPRQLGLTFAAWWNSRLDAYPPWTVVEDLI